LVIAEASARYTLIDLDVFKVRLRSFERIDLKNYPYTFDEFWKWKIEVETRWCHILDDGHRMETYNRLCNILPLWQTYRGVSEVRWREVLLNSLENMSEAYNQIRKYSLLEFSKVPEDALRLIWHELGRVKEKDGKRNDFGYYSIVAICKPLIFLWGQTVAFDSRVRAHFPRKYNVPKRNRWSFEDWKEVMEKIENDLKREPRVIKFFKEVSREKYGTDLYVPYGQFLDLYYWVWFDKV